MTEVTIRITEDEGEYTVDVEADGIDKAVSFKTARAAEAYATKLAKQYGVEWCSNY